MSSGRGPRRPHPSSRWRRHGSPGSLARPPTTTRSTGGSVPALEASTTAAPPRLGTLPRDQDEAAARERRALAGGDRVGTEDLSANELAQFSEVAICRHFFARMAAPAADRSQEIRRLADLLSTLEPRRGQRILAELLRAERLIDVYPLELLVAGLDREAGFAGRWTRGKIVLNRSQVESRLYLPAEAVLLRVPLGATVSAFALEGGGTPGYHLFPGPPGHYCIEIGSRGRYRVLLGARVRGMDIVDAVHVWVEPDPPARG